MGWLLAVVLSFTLEEHTRDLVEQQGHIENPTACIWDADDTDLWAASGSLGPGEVAGVGSCIIGDNVAHGALLQAVSRSDGLEMSVTLAGDGLSFTIPATVTKDGKLYRYRACIVGPDYEASIQLPPVGEGFGIEWTASVRIANPTTRTVRDVAASFRVGQDPDCRDTLLNTSPRVWA